MIKLFLEMFVSKAPAIEDTEIKDTKIQINIKKLDLNPQEKVIEVIDVIPTEVQ